ncbi:hypothetical protein BP6252_11909 [Coleophoma cylindrospora]|uniref:HD domain-containing protein n=1 Tax=Coleophoma cylindrospora TaxID=1849047 RepID=A0A3D8QKW7_9HELO|nr:hypothetical protein BP6252_11909 [Coleophoma cylindrospora]
MPVSREEAIKLYGWQALPVEPKLKKWLGDKKFVKEPVPQLCADVTLPDTPVVKACLEYAQAELPPHTFNHSMRVFYYGMAMRTQQFPEWEFTAETWLLTCLFHDIGTVDKHTHGTLLSFEFFGGYLALDVIQRNSGPVEQAESVAEAIIRHQDSAEVGTITTIGLLIQIATQFEDNMGFRSELIHPGTIEDVTMAYPRRNWSSCFSAKIREENAVKEWAHSTALGFDEFPDSVKNNKLMEPYDTKF